MLSASERLVEGVALYFCKLNSRSEYLVVHIAQVSAVIVQFVLRLAVELASQQFRDHKLREVRLLRHFLVHWYFSDAQLLKDLDFLSEVGVVLLERLLFLPNFVLAFEFAGSPYFRHACLVVFVDGHTLLDVNFNFLYSFFLVVHLCLITL